MAVNAQSGITKEGKVVSPCYRCIWCGEAFQRLKDAEAHEKHCEEKRG